jgi:hypothetical protein
MRKQGEEVKEECRKGGREEKCCKENEGIKKIMKEKRKILHDDFRC